VINNIRASLDRITEKSRNIIVNSDGEDIDVVQGREDALAGKPCKRTLKSYVNSYKLTTQRGIGTEKL
jgi:hypothetical protein